MTRNSWQREQLCNTFLPLTEPLFLGLVGVAFARRAFCRRNKTPEGIAVEIETSITSVEPAVIGGLISNCPARTTLPALQDDNGVHHHADPGAGTGTVPSGFTSGL